jgi:hypothetical protein
MSLLDVRHLRFADGRGAGQSLPATYGRLNPARGSVRSIEICSEQVNVGATLTYLDVSAVIAVNQVNGSHPTGEEPPHVRYAPQG